MVTSPTIEGALAEIAAARRDRDAEMFRAGAEAMREHAAEMAGGFLMTKTAVPVEKIVDCEECTRALDIPEMTDDR